MNLLTDMPDMSAGESVDEMYENLASRPGFLIRRLHQIHVAIFLEECKEFNVTPVQYSVLTALRQSDLDQTTLANKVGMDLATTAQVLRRLEERGWLTRHRNEEDRRQRIAGLSGFGRQMLAEMDAFARRAHERTVDHLEKPEREAFVRYLIKLVEANNSYSRAPLRLS